jgi:hypothetical protein
MAHFEHAVEQWAPCAMPRLGSSGQPKRLQAIHSISRIFHLKNTAPCIFDPRLMVVLSVL